MENTEFGSSEAASLGGKARANALTPGERSEIARRAADARHGRVLPKATHEGFLHIGDMEIPCAVLDGGKRVLTLSGFMVALGRARQAKSRRYYDGDVNLPTFLTAKNLKPFIPPDLEVTSRGFEFQTRNGQRAYGFAAELLPKVCGVFLDARADHKLKPNQEHIADKALTLVRALASTGIIALVDEATGYQYERPRRDLQEQLKKFLAESLVRYASGFPHDYLKHLCRLKGVELRPDMKLPQYFGHLTNDLVYRRIAPGLVRALKDRRAERGRPYQKMYQWTSEGIGYPALMLHLGTVVGLMKLHTDFDKFKKQLDAVAPVYPEVPGLFDKSEEWEKPAHP